MNFIQKIALALQRKSNEGYSLFQSGNMPSSDRNWGAGQYLNANNISLYTNRAIDKRAEKVGQIKFTLKDRKTQREITEHPLLNLLAKPNSFMSGFEFWKLYQKYKDLTGSTFIWLSGAGALRMDGTRSMPEELHLLRPDLVTIKFDNLGRIEAFVHRTPAKETVFTPAEIIYDYRPSLFDPRLGESLLRAGIRIIGLEDQLVEYQYRVLKNGGKIDGVMNFKSQARLNKVQLDELKTQYKEEYADASKSGRPLFLSGDADYKRMALTPEELAFLESKNMTLNDVCIMTGVPKTILAMVDGVQYNNSDASLRVFARETTKPNLDGIINKLDENGVLVPNSLELGYIDQTPEDVDQKLKINEGGIKNYYMTPNEARKNIGLEPIDGGDSLMVPFNIMTQDNKAAPQPKKIKSADEQEFKHPLQNKEFRDVYYKARIKKHDASENRFVTKLNHYFTGQEERLLEKIGATKSFKTKDIIDENFNMVPELQFGLDELKPMLEALLIEAGIDAMELMGSDYSFNAGSEIASWLDRKTEIFLNSVNETTFNELKSQFAESLAAGENREKLVQRIKNTYGNISSVRASIIARTEVHAVMQYGTMEGYKQAGAPIKIWVAVRDAHTRDSHAAQDGEERPINMPFSNGLMFPGDNNGPAAEVINCRCQI